MSPSDPEPGPPTKQDPTQQENQVPLAGNPEERSDSRNRIEELGEPCTTSGQDEGTSRDTTAASMKEAGQAEDNNDNDTAGVTEEEEKMEPFSAFRQRDTVIPVRGDSLSHSSRKGPIQPLLVNTDRDSPPLPPQKDEIYIDPTPKTPQAPHSPSGMPLDVIDKDLPEVPSDTPDNVANGKAPARSEGRSSEDSQSEIQSIMGQFADETKSLSQGEIMSPRLELAEQFLSGQVHFPPRKSSLEHIKAIDLPTERNSSTSWRSHSNSIQSASTQSASALPVVPPKSPPIPPQKSPTTDAPSTTTSPPATSGPPLPEPEPDRPFDFHRFLEQLRHRTADPVAKFLRSFLTEFGKKQWMVHEQVKIISDFLAFITNKMAQCEVWREVSDVEFDNAKEGMEKLVMNRLYSQTFSPALPPPPAPSRSRSRSRRRELERLQGPARRGQHQEDVERDDILAQKIRIYSWVKEEHLDIPPLGPNGSRFLILAQQELLKIKGYRAPRDKVICILNCCKVIFGLLRNAKTGDTSADSFMPLLIYALLKANPEHLVSNVQYILRFRNQEKLNGEAGYYLSSLSGAISFIETLDRTSLTVSDDEFESNVEAAVSAIAEKNKELEAPPAPSEKSSPSGPEVTPRNSSEGENYTRRKDATQSGSSEENAAVAGLLRTIQKPLTTIGRMFTDDSDSQPSPAAQQRVPSPRLPPAPPKAQPQPEQRTQADAAQSKAAEISPEQLSKFDAQEAAARQASAEAAEARRIQRAEHDTVVETLSGMFPNLDKDIIDDVVRMKEGRVGLAVDACLALSAEQ
ncbi:hypothetical protein AJ80_08994 [Polytolypa hystricis UAMH7299]|uniref:VPS9 domain-containing protein n=1 Tax=Polytolypa hystricis (strain UAMH7299) TaxID=1447883 RepID=A0A2B7WY77_POLH7|nr:hypothetical protein AJ80_08994 [Polytolypa hystricis UAMH7299]